MKTIIFVSMMCFTFFSILNQAGASTLECKLPFLAVSANAKNTISQNQKYLASADRESLVIKDLETGRLLWTLRANRFQFLGARKTFFSQDATRIFVKGILSTKVYDTLTGQFVFEIKNSDVFATSNNQVFISIAGKDLTIRDTRSGSIIYSTRIPFGASVFGKPSSTDDLSFQSGKISIELKMRINQLSHVDGVSIPVDESMHLDIDLTNHSEVVY